MEKRDFLCTVLIASATRKSAGVLSDMLCDAFSKPVFYAGSGAEARRMLMERAFDVVIINAPLPDEAGVDLALDISRRDCGALLLVKGEIFDEASRKAENAAVFVMAKPFSSRFFSQTQQLMIASRREIRTARNECARLQAKLEETKIVSYAKCLMVEFMGFTEQEAHRQIEKQAMDRRVSRREIAEQVIKKYEC